MKKVIAVREYIGKICGKQIEGEYFRGEMCCIERADKPSISIADGIRAMSKAAEKLEVALAKMRTI